MHNKKVDFMTAISSGKNIRSEYEDKDRYGYFTVSRVLMDLSNSLEKFAIRRLKGGWYIEDK